MIKNSIKNALIIYAALSCFSFMGCKKDKKLAATNQTVASKQTSDKNTPKSKKLSPAAKAFIEGKTIAVILGYGYNDSEKKDGIIQMLAQNYGVDTEEAPGLISVFTYPDNFTVSGKPRISSLINLIEDKKMCGMIILGAPEGTHTAISKLQDKTETGKLAFPVFTIFPQDDVLGSESTSFFVLDYAHKSDDSEHLDSSESTGDIPDFDVNKFLANAVDSILETQGELPQNDQLADFVHKIVGAKRKLNRYVDGETGLKSINHFIFE